MAGKNQRVWGQRCNKRTSFSGPVAVFSSFSSSLCIELSSCCRIISWNWAIPLSVSPLPRPGQDREDDGGEDLHFTQTLHISHEENRIWILFLPALLLYTDILPNLKGNGIKVTDCEKYSSSKNNLQMTAHLSSRQM